MFYVMNMRKKKLENSKRFFPHRWERAIDNAILNVKANPYAPLGLRLC
jgi:hypothetical protein